MGLKAAIIECDIFEFLNKSTGGVDTSVHETIAIIFLQKNINMLYGQRIIIVRHEDQKTSPASGMQSKEPPIKQWRI